MVSAGLVVPLAGRVVATGDEWEPYRLLDGGGAAVEAVRACPACRGTVRTARTAGCAAGSRRFSGMPGR